MMYDIGRARWKRVVPVCIAIGRFVGIPV